MHRRGTLPSLRSSCIGPAKLCAGRERSTGQLHCCNTHLNGCRTRIRGPCLPLEFPGVAGPRNNSGIKLLWAASIPPGGAKTGRLDGVSRHSPVSASLFYASLFCVITIVLSSLPEALARQMESVLQGFLVLAQVVREARVQFLTAAMLRAVRLTLWGLGNVFTVLRTCL